CRRRTSTRALPTDLTWGSARGMERASATVPGATRGRSPWGRRPLP
ncbi:MAG: hypothetical protein AVDCRST_MAG29-1584, partial [uncultured Nocardioidaceae bacterium]